MDTYPMIEIDLEKIKHNTEVLVDIARQNHIDIAGVTKVFCALPEIAQAIVEGGVSMLADSRLENIKKLNGIAIPKLLLRLPMTSQVNDVVHYTDISLNSEISTIEALGKAAVRLNKTHDIILMIDLGDLREGILREDVFNIVERILKVEGIRLVGIGTNLTCYGGIIPKKDNLGLLTEIAEEVESAFNISLNIISGGNSSSLYLLEQKNIPNRINHLRLGEAIVLGRETAFGNRILKTYDDAFVLKAEIIELKEKPSIPTGEIGMDAFGNKPVFEDKGVRKRAILAIGRQDVSIDNIHPKDEEAVVLGGSSDHLIVDVTDCSRNYAVGDQIDFKLEYGALLQLMTSDYVVKKIK